MHGNKRLAVCRHAVTHTQAGRVGRREGREGKGQSVEYGATKTACSAHAWERRDAMHDRERDATAVTPIFHHHPATNKMPVCSLSPSPVECAHAKMIYEDRARYMVDAAFYRRYRIDLSNGRHRH